MAISRIFDIANGSMATYQRAIDLTANNITNASNPNYSRKRVSLTSEKTQNLNGIEWGRGVKIGDVLRVRDRYVDNQLRKTYQDNAKNEKKAWIYNRIEQVFNETSGLGISDRIATFFTSWNKLAVNPASVPLRNQVITSAQNLSNKISEVYEGLETIQNDVYQEFSSNIGELNNYLSQLQEYNAKISNAYRMKKPAADDEDKRDEIIDKISKLVNINVNYDENNSANLSIGGIMAVDSMHALQFSADVVDGKLSLIIPERGIKTVLKSGELGALAEVYNNEVGDYKDQMDTIFNSLVEEVNSIHESGYNSEIPPVTGVKFFEGFNTGILKINQDILDDPKKLAASSDGTDGNGEIALRIAGLADEKVMNGTTFNQSYINMLTDVGNRSMSARDSADSNKLLIQQLEGQRASYSGVSIDEEMSNLIMYQKSYDASARLVKTANEMLDTLINMV